MQRREWLASALALAGAACTPTVPLVAAVDEFDEEEKPKGEPFSIFVPTPERAVLRMLELARVTANDLVLDLGSGDGRVPLLAASRFGARGWGVDINPELVEQSAAEAKRQGLSERVRFEAGDATLIDPANATVVTMYLFPALINRLRPMLFEKLKPGARIVIYDYIMAEWPPDAILTTYVPERYLGFGGDVSIRMWVKPANFSGDWRGIIASPVNEGFELHIEQRYQRIKGSLRIGERVHDLSVADVRGDTIEFVYEVDRQRRSLRATTNGELMQGTARVQRGESFINTIWQADRLSRPMRIDIAP